MSDLTGMFGLYNQSINAMPQARMYNTTVEGIPQGPMDNMDPMLQGAVRGLGEGFGLQGDFTTGQQKYKALYDAEQAKKLEVQKYREQLYKRAQDAGFSDLAERVRTGVVTEAEGAKELQKLERAALLAKVGGPAIEAMGKNLGMDEDQIAYAKTLPQKELNAYFENFKAEVEDFTAPGGRQVSLQVNNAGKVKIGKQWVDPSEAGLSANIPHQTSTSTVYNVSNEANEYLTKLAFDNVTRLQEAVVADQGKMETINSQLAAIEKMPTGLLADVKQSFREAGNALGQDWGDASAAQGYLINTAEDTLKMLQGMGGPDSDTDRKWAAQVVGGEIKMTKETLQRLYKIQAKAVQGRYKAYEAAFDSVKAAQQGGDAGMMEAVRQPAPGPLQVPQGAGEVVWERGPDGKLREVRK